MKQITCIGFLTFLSVYILAAPLFAADFAPIFPKQGAPVVAPPNFTWAAGDYDYFILYLYLPIPGHFYQPIPIHLSQKPYWRCPDALWDYSPMDRWCWWRVLGINTTTGDYEVTSWQYYQKVSDCVVKFPDPTLDATVRDEIGKPVGSIMASELETIHRLDARWLGIYDVGGLEYCTNLTWLRFGYNQIEDVSPLAGLTNLTDLLLGDNQIVDMCPLLDNLGLDFGNRVYLESNPLSTTSCTVCIPQLEGVGVYVNHDCP